MKLSTSAIQEIIDIGQSKETLEILKNFSDSTRAAVQEYVNTLSRITPTSIPESDRLTALGDKVLELNHQAGIKLLGILTSGNRSPEIISQAKQWLSELEYNQSIGNAYKENAGKALSQYIEQYSKEISSTSKILKTGGWIVDAISIGNAAHTGWSTGNWTDLYKAIGSFVGSNFGAFAGGLLAADTIAMLGLAATGPAGIIILLTFVGGMSYIGDQLGGDLGKTIGKLFDLFSTAEITRSPLIFDLDNNGIATLGSSKEIYFDNDSNGFAELTGWVSPTDGLLVIDKNGNGLIDNGNELFGNYSQLPGGTYAQNGFLALAAYDSNSDGKVDALDVDFSKLRVWKDANSNGVTDAGELITLVDANVQSISVSYTDQTVTDANSNQHLQLGQYTDRSGVAHVIEDVWFKVDTARTVDKNLVTVSADIAALPDVAGFGNVHSLHQAMARDTTGHLKELVQQFATTTDADARAAIVTSLIYAWAGVQNVDPTSRAATQIYGNVIGDARKLEALEEFLGEEYLGTWCWGERDPNPHGPASKILLSAFDTLAEYVSSQLLQQTQFKTYYDSIALVIDDTTGQVSLDVSGFVGQLQTAYATNATQGLHLMAELAVTLNYAGSLGTAVIEAIRAQGNADTPGFYGDLSHFGLNNTLGTASANKLTGSDTSNDLILGMGGNDTLIGGGGNDTLEGGSGDDYLQGGGGADTYLYSVGWGEDVIFNADADGVGVNPDRIVFSDGIDPAQINVARVGFDLVLTRYGSTDSTTIFSYFDADAESARGYAVELIHFADGTEWTPAMIRSMVLGGGLGNDAIAGYASGDSLTGAAGNDTIHGWDGNDSILGGTGNDILYGDAGNDVIAGNEGTDRLYGWTGNDSLHGGAGADNLIGEAGNDTLDGGTGNDSLTGGAGADTYVFGLGSGQDTLYNNDADALGVNADTLQLGAGISAADLTLTRSGNHLLIAINGTTDQLLVSNYFYLEGTSVYAVENIRLADGTVWDLAAVKARVLAPTADNDILDGYASNDSISGADGNDSLTGNAGNDSLDGGTGADTLRGGDGSDLLLGGIGNDLFYGGTGDDSLNGGAGSDNLSGEAGNDTLDGGTGNDSLTGGAGADTYVFGLGSGQDTLYNNDADALGVSADTLQLGAGISAADLTLTRSGNHLIITINGSTDQLLVYNYFYLEGASVYAVENIRLADGTVWDIAAVKARLTVAATDLVLTGTTAAEVLTGGQGNDRLTGNAGNDTLDGGTGDDALTGGLGNDTYRFGRGHGQDTVSAADATAGKLDVIELASGIAPTDVQLTRSGDALVLSLSGTGDTLTVSSHFYLDAAGGYQIDQIRFADGTAWDQAAIKLKVLAGTSEDDTLYGYAASADSIAGQAGDDTLWGRAGNDTLDGGAGRDLLRGEDGDDLIDGGPNNDTLYGGNGVDTLRGQSGNDLLYGEAGNDTLDGGLGTDTLSGGAGDDTYIINDELDRIDESAKASFQNKLPHDEYLR